MLMNHQMSVDADDAGSKWSVDADNVTNQQWMQITMPKLEDAGALLNQPADHINATNHQPDQPADADNADHPTCQSCWW